jgi:hypothetical protein
MRVETGSRSVVERRRIYEAVDSLDDEVTDLVIASRSLGALLGLASLQFVQSRAERCDDESAGLPAILNRFTSGEVTGVAVIGAGPGTVDLAANCARHGLRLVVLLPRGDGVTAGEAPTPDTGSLGWLAALGAQVISVAATTADVQRAAPMLLTGSRLRLLDAAVSSTAAQAHQRTDHTPRLAGGADTDDPDPTTAELSAAFVAASAAGELLALGSADADLSATLESLAAAQRTETLALPFADNGAGSADAAVALLGAPAADWKDQAHSGAPMVRVHAAAAGGPSRILTVPVSHRDAVAMQRLLAREEGLIVSDVGAMGAAGLVRALFEDRARRPRERRLRTVRAVRLLLPSERDAWSVSPPLTEDAVPGPLVALPDLVSSLRRWLVEPPRPLAP